MPASHKRGSHPCEVQALQRGSLQAFKPCHRAAEKLARLAGSGLLSFPGGRADMHWQIVQGAAVSSDQVRGKKEKRGVRGQVTGCGGWIPMGVLPHSEPGQKQSGCTGSKLCSEICRGMIAACDAWSDLCCTLDLTAGCRWVPACSGCGPGAAVTGLGDSRRGCMLRTIQRARTRMI